MLSNIAPLDRIRHSCRMHVRVAYITPALCNIVETEIICNVFVITKQEVDQNVNNPFICFS